MKTGKEKTKLPLFETTIPSISCGEPIHVFTSF